MTVSSPDCTATPFPRDREVSQEGVQSVEKIRTALTELHPLCFGWAMTCCDRRPQEAEEVLQISYLKVLEGRAQFHGRSAFKTWFFSVIRYTALDRKRRFARRIQSWSRWLAGGDRQESVAPGPECRVETAELTRALKKLPLRQRQLLHLVFYQGLTIAEAAEVIQVSVGTARTHYGRGKKRLRKELSHE